LTEVLEQLPSKRRQVIRLSATVGTSSVFRKVRKQRNAAENGIVDRIRGASVNGGSLVDEDVAKTDLEGRPEERLDADGRPMEEVNSEFN